MRPKKNIKNFGFFSKMLLKRKGRLDSKKGVIRLLDGHYISPFIVQEIHICIAQICSEKECLQNAIFPMSYSIARNKHNFDTSFRSEEFNREILENDNIRNTLTVNKEIINVEHRCEEIYNYMVARLSVYWDGVLMEQSKSMEIPPIFDIEIVLKNVIDEIESIKSEE